MTGSLKGLGSRAIIGAFYKALDERMAASWLPLVAAQFQSNQESETYGFLGDTPKMAEWKGPRGATTPKKTEFSLTNKKYQASLEIDADDLRRDKTGQIMARVNELAARAAQLPQRLISDLINSNGNAYDAAAFFHDSSHVNANGDTIDNIISVAASSGTTPSVAEATDAILQAIQQILAFKDDAGEPRNEFATQFLVMCPPVMWAPVLGAVRNDFTGSGASNTLKGSNFVIQPTLNARLTATDKIYVFRSDADIKPFIWQDDLPTEIKQLGEESDWYMLRDSLLFGVKRVCAAGYGRFDQACQVTFT